MNGYVLAHAACFGCGKPFAFNPLPQATANVTLTVQRLRLPGAPEIAALNTRFSLQGGRSTKSGERAQGAGGYGLNPKGQPHSAMIAQETVALVIYAGEPDEIRSMEIVDIAEAAA